jgi:ribosomal protein S3
MFDEEWQNFRAEAHAFMKNKEESVIKKWLNEIGYTEPVGYYRNVFTREMEIYTRRPGCLIGKAGVNVRELESMLNEQFLGEWKVKFIEIRGGFVQT